jgi:phage shock protein A
MLYEVLTVCVTAFLCLLVVVFDKRSKHNEVTAKMNQQIASSNSQLASNTDTIEKLKEKLDKIETRVSSIFVSKGFRKDD